MSVLDRRSRSTTAISQRPLSRDSTASLQSTAPRIARSESLSQYNNQAHFAPQPMPAQSQQFEQYPVMQNIPQHHYQTHHGLPMQAEHPQHYHPQVQNQASMYHSHSMQTYNTNNNISQANQYPIVAQSSSSMANAHQPTPDPEQSKKRTGSGAAATQSNEKELRESLNSNIHRSLKDVAKEVIDSERTSRAEKTKQLFAMLWLNSSCEQAKTSVPRSRVYASYADRCATERVQPLNPASFGKLVRVIFKDIQTRRLGVRGESKYHYVDLALKSENEENEQNSGRSAAQEEHSPTTTLNFHNVPPLPAVAAAYNFDGSPIASPVLGPADRGQIDGAVFADPTSQTFRTSFPYSQTYPQQLCFPSSEDDIITNDVELPDLWAYAPENADEDAARALMALYRSHCTSLIEYFKKCKEKQFWRTFSNFQGTLTVPVQKLLTAPSMAAWIRECDYYMYQRMLSFASRIALHVLPVAALNFFNTISLNIHPYIVKTFNGMPLHVLEARLEPATRFSELVSRMVKVNNAAHAASQVLENDEGRDQLLNEWVGLVNPKRIMEGELPGCGYEETFKILTQDMATLLRPLSPPNYQNDLQYVNSESQPESVDNYIDRIDMLLRSLPARFPQASPRTIVSCVKNLSTAAMREFTMQGAQSFHAWWIVKVFVDEYSQWLVTSGGFMAHRPARRGQSSPALSGSLQNGAVGSNAEESIEHSRRNSVAPVDGDNDESTTGGARPTKSNNGKSKRRSDEFDVDDHQPEQTAKRARNTPEPNEAPQFEQPHPSFGTSFGSTAAPNDPADLPEFDDSGIGLGLDEPPSTRKTSKLASSAMDRAPLLQHFGDVDSTAIAI